MTQILITISPWGENIFHLSCSLYDHLGGLSVQASEGSVALYALTVRLCAHLAFACPAPILLILINTNG